MSRKKVPTGDGERDGRAIVTSKTVRRAVAPTEGGGTDLAPPGAVAGVPAVIRDGGTTLIQGRPYVAGGRLIADASAYRVDGMKGVELGEADKIAWLDHATGYECIILRSAQGGHLGGYVGIPPEHPLYGFPTGAIPAELGIEVHGGISYAAACEEGPESKRQVRIEARRICHVEYRTVPTKYASDYRVEHRHAWWLGFECDRAYDLQPDRRGPAAGFLASEIGQVYRDEGYVHDQVLDLAAQLRAIADGLPRPERIGAPPPPRGLDPAENG